MRYKKSVYILVIIAIVMFLCMFCALIGCGVQDTQKETVTVEMPIVYDSDSTVLKEHNMFCPFCGADTIAMNGEIVCRNNDCDMYGLPIRVAKCDNSMDGNCEFYYGEYWV